MRNIPQSIIDKLSSGLHIKAGHPICTIKDILYGAFPDFAKFDGMPQVVNARDNFDLLRIPPDHPSRRTSDTYYWDDEHVLRTHTSAHQVQLLKDGHTKFLVVGDVYRKDDIDATHYPIFHQMEGVCITDRGEPETALKNRINEALYTLFPGADLHWNNDYFPFTDPSWEVAVDYNGMQMEVLGCGVIHPEILANAGLSNKQGWAFGLGLERLAMKLFNIPDIRLFWSKDRRFRDQFEAGKISEFKPFSSQPACYKDIAFWVADDYEKTAFFELVREIAGDLIEKVVETDSFSKNGRVSKCYRITYRAMDRSLLNDEINAIQTNIRNETKKLGVTLR